MCQWVWGDFCCCYPSIVPMKYHLAGVRVGFPESESELGGSGGLWPSFVLFKGVLTISNTDC